MHADATSSFSTAAITFTFSNTAFVTISVAAFATRAARAPLVRQTVMVPHEGGEQPHRIDRRQPEQYLREGGIGARSPERRQRQQQRWQQKRCNAFEGG